MQSRSLFQVVMRPAAIRRPDIHCSFLQIIPTMPETQTMSGSHIMFAPGLYQRHFCYNHNISKCNID